MTTGVRGPAGIPNRPARVVALGGGTGLPNLLRGLRKVVGNGDPSHLTAVVTMTDDGGISTMWAPPGVRTR